MASTLLTFSKVGSKWRSTCSVTKNFNIHVEDGGKSVRVYQKTAGTKWCLVGESLNCGDCYDYDFGNYVYPKSIIVECESNPSVAYLTEGA